jgi:amino acid permease
MRRKWGDNIPLLLQFGTRVIYVGFTTLVALLIPFFGALMGLVGAVAITPTTFLFPPLMWVMYKKPKKWGLDWSANWSLVWITGILGVLGCVGSLYNIVAGWSKFKIFNA